MPCPRNANASEPALYIYLGRKPWENTCSMAGSLSSNRFQREAASEP